MSQYLENKESEIIRRNLVSIKSIKPVSVFVINSRRNSSESYTAVPISKWGKEYVVMSMPNDQYAIQAGTDSIKNAQPRRSQFLVMAAYDSTLISYTPTTMTDKGKSAGVERSVMLMKGDCYLVKSYKFPMGQGDLTGTIIKGDKPFGVLSGHVRTGAPQGMPIPLNSKNHIVEMLMPVESWGKEFITVPFGVNVTGDFIKITSYYPNTNITYTIDNVQKTKLLEKPGDFAAFENINVPVYWQADKPVQLAQIMMHNGYFGDTEYDPAMAVVHGSNNFGKYSQFVTLQDSLTLGLTFQHYLYIVCDSNAVGDLKLDSFLVNDFIDIDKNIINGTGYHYAKFEIENGYHSIETKKGKFSGVIFGTTKADAYAMPLGSGMDTDAPIMVVNDSCGILSGIITDAYNFNFTGIKSCTIVSGNTYNYIYEIGDITDTSTIIPFTAHPMDFGDSARIEIEFTDNSGNSGSYKYFYEPLKISFDKNSIEFKYLNQLPSEKEILRIGNLGTKPVTLNELYFRNKDARISHDFSNPFPHMINAKSFIQVNIIYTESQDKTDIHDTLTAVFECDTAKNIPVNGYFAFFEISPGELDFGQVEIGKEKCRNLMISNPGLTNSITIADLKQLQLPDVFIIDTAGLFPFTLAPNAAKTIRICFRPKEDVVYYDTLTFSLLTGYKYSVIVKGMGRKPNSVTDNSEERKSRLEQNIPNPFSDKTTINYSIGRAGKYRLYVTSLVGDVLINIFDEYKMPGNYSFEFLKNQLPDGCYLYTLESLDGKVTRKLIIID